MLAVYTSALTAECISGVYVDENGTGKRWGMGYTEEGRKEACNAGGEHLKDTQG